MQLDINETLKLIAEGKLTIDDLSAACSITSSYNRRNKVTESKVGEQPNVTLNGGVSSTGGANQPLK